MWALWRDYFKNIVSYEITGVETQVSQALTTFSKKFNKHLRRYFGSAAPRQIYTFQSIATFLQIIESFIVDVIPVGFKIETPVKLFISCDHVKTLIELGTTNEWLEI